MAKFGSPWGIRGHNLLHLFCSQPTFFTHLDTWWCHQGDDNWQSYPIDECFYHNKNWIVRLAHISNRNEAKLWAQGVAAVLRHQLPVIDEDAIYWCDLIGTTVINTDNQILGEISDLMNIGAHDILVINPITPKNNQYQKPILIPFINRYVYSTSLEKRCMIVHWQADW